LPAHVTCGKTQHHRKLFPLACSEFQHICQQIWSKSQEYARAASTQAVDALNYGLWPATTRNGVAVQDCLQVSHATATPVGATTQATGVTSLPAEGETCPIHGPHVWHGCTGGRAEVSVIQMTSGSLRARQAASPPMHQSGESMPCITWLLPVVSLCIAPRGCSLSQHRCSTSYHRCSTRPVLGQIMRKDAFCTNHTRCCRAPFSAP